MKRIIKWLGGVIIGAVLTFIVLGFIFPSHEYSNEYIINASRMQVYTSVINPLNMKKWVNDLKHAKYVSGIPGFPDSKVDLTFEVDGTTFVVEQEMIKNKPGELLKVRFNHNMLKGQLTMNFKAGTTGQTKLEVNSEYEGKSWLHRSILVFYFPAINRRFDNNYKALKELIEKY